MNSVRFHPPQVPRTSPRPTAAPAPEPTRTDRVDTATLGVAGSVVAGFVIIGGVLWATAPPAPTPAPVVTEQPLETPTPG